jgi:hypothetical protein
MATDKDVLTLIKDENRRSFNIDDVPNRESGHAAPRRRSRTVPPELPRGSGDAALASPAVVPPFEKRP